MMCFGGGGGGERVEQQSSTPAIPTSVDPVVQQARAAAVRKNRMAAGSMATILTRSNVVASQRASLTAVLPKSNPAAAGAPAANKVLMGQ